MKSKAFFLFTVSFFVAFVLIMQYQSYRSAQTALSRDSSLNYVKQINLLIADNKGLKTEAERLQSEIQNLESAADASALLEKEIAAFLLLNGKSDVSGTGVKIEIDLPLEHFWLTDLCNELYLAGAQAVSLNQLRLTGHEGFMARDNESEIYLNNTQLITRPYLLEAIGDKETLYKYLTEYNSVLRRLQSNFADSSDLVKISKEDQIRIPAAR